MAATYEPIATTTLATAASSITFSSIPATYTDLRLVVVGNRVSGGALALQFNNDTSTDYSATRLQGNGSTASSARETSATSISTINWDATNKYLFEIDIFSYAGSTNKTCLIAVSGDENGGGTAGRFVGLWRDTSAINEIDIIITSGTIAAGTTFSLYGILKA